MSEFIFTDNPVAIHYAIPGFTLLLFIEIGVAVYEQRDWYDTKDTVSSLSMGIGNAIIRLFTKVVMIAVFFFVYQFRLFDLSAAWWVWVLCFFAEDLSYCAFHRASHEVRYFWASHVVCITDCRPQKSAFRVQATARNRGSLISAF